MENTSSVASENQTPVPATEPGGQVLRQFEPARQKQAGNGKLFIILGVLVLTGAGIATGWALARQSEEKGALSATGVGEDAEIATGKDEYGIIDEKVFTDSAEGKLERNDMTKIMEGSHRLLRAGGPSQTAYVTSSVVDLSQFEGECVKIWGETFEGQQAGWLMDVGRLKVLDSCPEGL